MYEQGAELLRLFAVRRETLPFSDSVAFQLQYKKELFPDTEYAEIEDTAYFDMVVRDVPTDHPMLPLLNTSRPTRDMVVDIKTSGKRYPVDSRLLRMDPQLRRYSWLSGIETVAFLVGVRKNRGLDRGDVVTVLDGELAGKVLTVFQVDDNGIVNLMPEQMYANYMEAQKGIRGKALVALKVEWAEACHKVPREQLTNQELQFLCTTISDVERWQTGEVVGREVQDIYESERTGLYPQRPGIRFPANHCTFCPYLGLCIGDENMVNSKLINISENSTTGEKDWISELED